MIKIIDFIESLPLSDSAVKDIQGYLKGNSNDTAYSVIKSFENDLSQYLNVKYCVCVNSGTTGLILAFKVLGVDKEVIVPSFTFSGSVHALAWNGIVPKFTDIDEKSFNLDLKQVRQNINKKTRAILAVNIFGNPANIDELESLAKKFKLKLIFDSAHGFGCKYKGKMLGGHGDLEVFSLQSSKVLSVLEGGFISTNQESVYKNLLLLRSQGNLGDGNCLQVGLNARMHPLAAVLGKAALKEVNAGISKRQELGQHYCHLLSKIPGIFLQQINEYAKYNYQYMPILIKKNVLGVSRDKLMTILYNKRISTRKYFHPPVHRFNCYRTIKKSFNLKVTNYISENVLCLPFSSLMTFEEIEYICKSIKTIQEKK